METTTITTEHIQPFEAVVKDFLESEEISEIEGDSWEQINTLFDVIGEKEMTPIHADDKPSKCAYRSYLQTEKYGNFLYLYKENHDTGEVKFFLIKKSTEDDN